MLATKRFWGRWYVEQIEEVETCSIRWLYIGEKRVLLMVDFMLST